MSNRSCIAVLIVCLVGLSILPVSLAQQAVEQSDPQAIVPDIESGDWTALFNGESLAGWVQRNGTATYKVTEGVILGTTAIGSPNSFLCTDKDYSNFELTFEVKVDSRLNSGVQIRSTSKKDIASGRVRGPQIEIEASHENSGTPCESGYIYSEGTGRGWISQNRVASMAFVNDQWNRFVVRAVGPRVQTWINGHKVEDLYDDQSSQSGFIALQVHSIPKEEGPYEVRWRDIRVRTLDESPVRTAESKPTE